MMSRKLAIATLTVVSTLALSACGGAGGGATAEGEQTLTLGVLGEPNSWDPAQAHVGHSLQLFQPVYDSLLRREPDGTLVPMLAEEWTWTDAAKTTLEMTLRTDVTFSDGAVFDADAVVANIEHFKVDNGPQANQAASIESVEAVDDHTVRFQLSAPDPALEYFFSQALGLMGSPAALGTDEMDSVPVGSGPYTMSVDQTVVGSQYVLTARDGYWDDDLQSWDTINLRVLADSAARANAVSAHEIDATLLDATTAQQGEQAGFELLEYPTDWSGLLLFDRGGALDPALGDVRVRQAINYAFDREQLMKELAGGKGEVTSQVFGPDSSAYLPELDDYYTYDPDKARSLLAEAGYADGLTIELPQITPNYETITAFIVQQLADVGITVKATAVVQQDFLTTVQAGKYPAAYFNLFQGPTPVAYQQLLAPTSAYNPFGSTSPELEAAAADLGSEDEATAEQAAQELNRLVTEDAWFAPWYRPSQLYFFDPATVTVVAQQQMAVPSIYSYKPVS